MTNSTLKLTAIVCLTVATFCWPLMESIMLCNMSSCWMGTSGERGSVGRMNQVEHKCNNYLPTCKRCRLIPIPQIGIIDADADADAEGEWWVKRMAGVGELMTLVVCFVTILKWLMLVSVIGHLRQIAHKCMVLYTRRPYECSYMTTNAFRN